MSALRISCLHTATSNAAVFDSVCRSGVTLSHMVRPDLLAQAERDGADSARSETANVLRLLSREADAVLLTCSTLGDAADAVVGAASPVLRSDTPLLLAVASRRGVALCAAPSTLAPTRALASRVSPTVDVSLVGGAWSLFHAGKLDDYHRAIADAVDAALAAGATCVGLVQCSMTPAASLCRRGTPLTAPAAALAAAVATIG